MSNWCNPNKWFRDKLFSQPHKSIPKNEINDTNIQKRNFIFSIVDNTCFNKIPYIDCNNIDIVVSSGAISDTAKASFNCEILTANNVRIGKNVSINHWNNDTYCTYDASTISLSSGTNIDKIICQTETASGTGFYSLGTIKNSIIITDSLYLGSGAEVTCTDIDFATKITAQSGSLFSVNVSVAPNTTLNGKFNIYEKSYINCTGVGDFYIENSTIGSDGYLNGNIILTSGSINSGQIISNNDQIVFSGNSTINYGMVFGNCVFVSGASNSGTVSGLAIFSGVNSINYGAIENGYFYNTINSGIINNIATMYNSTNLGLLKNGGNFYNSPQSGSIRSGDVLLNNSHNYGYISGSNITLISGSKNISGSIIDGNNILFSSGINEGNIFSTGSLTFKDRSINSGYCIAPTITFLDFAINNGILHKSSLINFLNKSINNFSLSIIFDSGIINFKNQTINSGNISITGIESSLNFYDNSVNYGYTSGNLVNFYNSSINSGSITSTGLFYNTSKHISSGLYNPDLYFCNQAINSGTFINSTFRDQAINYGSGIRANFFNKSINSNSGSLNLNDAIFFDDSVNNLYATITGMSGAIFYNQSINSGSINLLTFYNKSMNYGSGNLSKFYDFSQNAKYTKTGIFYNSSYNNNTATGLNCFFYDYAYNKGYIINSGLFFNSGSNDTNGFVQNAIFTDFTKNKSSFNRPNNIVTFDEILQDPFPIIVFSGNSINYGDIVDCIIQFNSFAKNIGNIKYGTMFFFRQDGIFIKSRTTDNSIELQHISQEADILHDTEVFLSIFYGCNNNYSISFPSIIFSGNSINSGAIVGYYSYYFNNQSKNFGSISCFPVVPNMHDIAFFNGGYNSGNITNGITLFTNSTNFGNILCKNFNQSNNYGTLINAPLSNYSYNTESFNSNCPLLETFDTIIFSGSKNSGQCLMNSQFIDSFNYGNIQGSGSFIRSNNYGFVRDMAIFDTSINSGNIGGDTSFLNSSNYGSIRGQAIFDMVSCTGSGSIIYGSILASENILSCN